MKYFITVTLQDYNYFRLKMVDLDGNYKYSKIVNTETNCKSEKELLIYPNLIGKDTGTLNIKLFSERDETQINIVDMLGRKVNSISLEVEWNTISLDISDFPSGIYNVQVAGEKILRC